MTGPPPGWLEHLGAVRAAVRDVSDPDLQAARQEWDKHWVRANEQGLTAGMTPGRAGLRAMNVTEARHGPRPEPKETR